MKTRQKLRQQRLERKQAQEAMVVDVRQQVEGLRQQLECMGLECVVNPIRYGAVHVVLLRDRKPVAHWYPNTGNLFLGDRPISRLNGTWNPLADVLGAIPRERPMPQGPHAHKTPVSMWGKKGNEGQ